MDTQEDRIRHEQPVIAIDDITKTYVMGETKVHALQGVSLTIENGEYVAIIGTSGSGKSTLMNMIGLLDHPNTGSYRVRGRETGELKETEMADLRNAEIGFVFQRFNLLARTDAKRQVELPLFYAGVSSSEASERALEALNRVGLGDRTDHRTDELSGGQQQRVAIARALVNRPSILLADEPTGALDTTTGEEIMALFDELHGQGMTLIVVTHDMEVADRAQRIVTLRDGLIVSDERRDTRQDAPAAPQTHIAADPVPAGLAVQSPVAQNGHIPGEEVIDESF